MPEIKTMKIVVGAMTLLLVSMLGLLAYGMIRNSKQTTASATEVIMGSIAAWNKPLPAGASVVDISAAGPNLAVLADTPQGRTIYLIDPKTGEIRGTLVPAP